MRNLSPGRRHLVNAYEVEAGIGVIAGNTVWSMPERLECEVLQKARCINTLTYLPTYKQIGLQDDYFLDVINRWLRRSDVFIARFYTSDRQRWCAVVIRKVASILLFKHKLSPY